MSRKKSISLYHLSPADCIYAIQSAVNLIILFDDKYIVKPCLKENSAMIRHATAHIDAAEQYHTIKQEDRNKTK